ncbi:MAG: hypothetical protein ACUVV6_01820 [Thermoplasmatota archaeon]
MPERVVNSLTGAPPEVIFPLPLETWDDHDIQGDDVVLCEVSRVTNHWGEVVAEPRERLECRAIFYQSLLGWTGTGIVVPQDFLDRHSIREGQYLEVFLYAVRRGGEEKPIYPGQMVEREIRKRIRDPSTG